jgi:hypothetical protein
MLPAIKSFIPVIKFVAGDNNTGDQLSLITGIKAMGGKFATSVVYTGGKQLEQLSNC